MEQGRIVKVSGPLVVAEGLGTSRMYDLVRVGEEGLMGEIIEMRKDRCSIQVYEETEGLGPGHARGGLRRRPAAARCAAGEGGSFLDARDKRARA